LSGRGLCDELITRPEESYRLCCVVVCDLETSRIGAPYIHIYDISSLRVNELIEVRKFLLQFGSEFSVFRCAIQILNIKIYSVITLRKERSPRVFENRLPRKISGSKWDMVTGERRRLYKPEFHDL